MKNGIIRNKKNRRKKIEFARVLRKRMTKAERKFWDRVRNRKLDNLKFRRQQVIVGFIADFYCDQLDLVVEIDGGVHDEEYQQIIDAVRDVCFAEKGLRVLRVRNNEVLNDIETVVQTIRKISALNTKRTNNKR